MSASTARIGALVLIAAAVVLLVLTLILDGNRMWLALGAVFCALAGGWMGTQARRPQTRT